MHPIVSLLPPPYEENICEPEFLPSYEDIAPPGAAPTYYRIKKCKRFFTKKEYYRVKIYVRNRVVGNIEHGYMHNSHLIRIDFWNGNPLFIPIPTDVKGNKHFTSFFEGRCMIIEMNVAKRIENKVPITSSSSLYGIGITMIYVL